MIRILYIPLDERPCNRKLPVEQFPPGEISGIEIITPPIELLGRKKTAASYIDLWHWVCENIRTCHRAVLSIEMLIYGGLLPSRIHNLDEETLQLRIQELKHLLEEVDIPVYAFNLIMRTPRYDSADEEPDYWESWGSKIYRRSLLINKLLSGLADPEDEDELSSLTALIPGQYIEDYEKRRELNRQVTFRIIDLYKSGIITYLIIPQDDSSELGYTNLDRLRILEKERNIIMFPGADEAGSTLLCRAALDSLCTSVKKKICLLYDNKSGKGKVPNYEGISVEKSLGYQIKNCGGVIVPFPEDADLIFAVQTVDALNREAWDQGNSSEEEMIQKEFLDRAERFIEEGKALALADIRYSNGGDLLLMEKMEERELFTTLKAYGAWNTSGNTIGSVLSRALIEINWPDEETRKKNLRLHLIDDLFYQSQIRQHIRDRYLEELNLSYFDLREKSEDIARIVKKELVEKITRDDNKSLAYHKDLKISFPWNRLFEIEIGGF